MFNLIKGILYRMFKDRVFLILSLVILPVTIFIAIYFSSSVHIKGNIGVVNMDEINVQHGDYNVIYLDSKPELSELVENKYDGFIYKDEKGIEVETLRGEKFGNNVKAALMGEKTNISTEKNRGVASNIVGFITMFILMEGVMLYKFYYKEKGGVSNRILSSSISRNKYIYGHFISTFLIIFMPVIIVIFLAKLLLNINMEISMLNLSFVIFTLSFFAAAFGIILVVCIESDENASLLGNMFALITTLLSGSFFVISKDGVAKSISYLFPQKYLLDFTMAFENGESASYISLVVIILVSIIFIKVASIVNKSKIV
jgi:ABC-2 type transport system permease protein